MSIRRKSTTHDLATLRLHPDGSRVQQSSVNTKHRTASSTLVDPRGNWIAKDAGGRTSIKTRRSVSIPTDDGEGEFINLSGDEDDGSRSHSESKGKQRARDSQPPDEDSSGELEPDRTHLNLRTKRRLSFMRDFSFLDPPLALVSSQDAQRSDDVSGRDSPVVSFSDPAPDLLKSIHHFASCYYRERGQLFDGSRYYRGGKKERRKQSQENIHTLSAHGPNIDSEEDERLEVDDALTEEDEDDDEEMDDENGGREGSRNDSGRKDMYKALDGSALMAIGIVLQEYVAHTVTSRPRPSADPRSSKRRRIESTSRDSHHVSQAEHAQ